MSNLLEITTLGGLTIRGNGKLVTGFASRKAEALLVYLACIGRPQSREVLADLLWDERSQTQALTNLRTVLTSLRQQLAPYLLTDRQSIGLNPANPYRLDIADLDAGLRNASDQRQKSGSLSAAAASQLEQSLTLYRGDFLEGFFIRDCKGFEDWMLLERERVRHQVIDALHHLVEHHLENRNFLSGIAQATRLLQLDPLREDAHRQMMLMLAQTGQRGAALTQYETYRRLLDEELGLAPSQETTDLYEAVYNGNAATTSIKVNDAAKVPQNPYKGLRAFQEADAPDFFGRGDLIQVLLKRLAEPDEAGRFLAVIGPSGSGKSSAVWAGLIPALRHGALPGSNQWPIAAMYPGGYPLAELEAALLRVAVNAPDSLLTQLQENEYGLLRAVKRILPEGNTELVLVIDQFEEVFTLVDDEHVRAHFLSSLCAAVRDPRSRLRVIITLRADFMDRPLRYTEFGELVRQQCEFVLPLSAEGLQQAILKPAELHGLSLEPDLVAAIMRDVDSQPGTLPLMQYALTELFEQRVERCLTLKAYRDSGGVYGALGRRANDLYAALDPKGEEAARQLFVRLITPGEGIEDTRRRAPRAELASITADPNALNKVIDSYSRYRLLTFDRDPVSGGPTLEIAHEALISSWARLRGWIDDSREDLLTHRRLMGAATDWRSAGQESSFLATGARLAQFEVLAQEANLKLNREEREYLEASIAQQAERRSHDIAIARRVQRFEWATVILAIVGILSLIATGTAVWTANQVALQVSNASGLIESLRLAALANTMLTTGKAETAALLSIRALENHYSIQADTALAQAVDQLHPWPTFVHTSGVSSAAFSPDGSRFATGTADGGLWLWDTMTYQPIFQVKVGTNKVNRVTFSLDGSRLLAGDLGGILSSWNAHDGTQIRQFQASPSGATSIAFMPGGSMAAVGDNAGTVRLWNMETGQQIREIQTKSASVTALATDGTTLLTAGSDYMIRVWDTSNGSLLRQIGAHSDTVYDIAFSPDGKSIVSSSADKTAQVWALANGQGIAQYAGHTGAVRSVTFSPDGKFVATVGADKLVRIWDISSGFKSRQFMAQLDTITVVAFSPDGKTILTGSADKTAKLWDTDIDASIRYACQYLSGDVTDEQRQQFLLFDKLPTCPTATSVYKPTGRSAD